MKKRREPRAGDFLRDTITEYHHHYLDKGDVVFLTQKIGIGMQPVALIVKGKHKGRYIGILPYWPGWEVIA